MRIRFFSTKTVPDVLSCRLQRSPRVLATPQGDEVVLFDTTGERYFTLNDVGTRIWTMLGKPTTCTEIVNGIRREYDAPSDPEHDPVERDVSRLLRDLQAAGLVIAEPLSPASR